MNSHLSEFNNLHSIIIIMKKDSPKSTKVSATAPKASPAKKSAAVTTKDTAVKKVPAKAAPKAVVTAVKRPAAAAAKAPAVKRPAATAPGVKTPAKKVSGTVITALVDVGFGNTLYMRGEGAGLSWDSGTPLISVADNKWEISLPASNGIIAYKLLINDFNWSVGEDFQFTSGSNVTVTPEF